MNQRLDAATLRFLLSLNAYLPRFNEGEPNPERGDIVAALEAISAGPKPAGDPEMLRGILKLYEASNAAVAARFLRRPDGVLFSNVRIPDEKADDSALTAERAIEIAAHLWKWKMRHFLRARQRGDNLATRISRFEAAAKSAAGVRS